MVNSLTPAAVVPLGKERNQKPMQGYTQRLSRCMNFKIEGETHQDGAGRVDDVSSNLDQIDGSYQELLLQVRALPNLLLRLAGLDTTKMNSTKN